MSFLDFLFALEFEWPWAFLLLPLPLLLLYKRQADTPALIAPQVPLYETAISLGIGESQTTLKPKHLENCFSTICLASGVYSRRKASIYRRTN